MEISKLKIFKLITMDVYSKRIYYSAVIDGTTLIEYMTDGVFNKHLSLKEWKQHIKDNLK